MLPGHEVSATLETSAGLSFVSPVENAEVKELAFCWTVHPTATDEAAFRPVGVLFMVRAE